MEFTVIIRWTLEEYYRPRTLHVVQQICCLLRVGFCFFQQDLIPKRQNRLLLSCKTADKHDWDLVNLNCLAQFMESFKRERSKETNLDCWFLFLGDGMWKIVDGVKVSLCSNSFQWCFHVVEVSALCKPHQSHFLLCVQGEYHVRTENGCQNVTTQLSLICFKDRRLIRIVFN